VEQLFPYANLERLGLMTINNIDIKELENFQQSIRNLKVIKDIGIVQANSARTHRLLAILCDFFMQLRQLNLVIGYSIKRKKISISIRSEIKRYHASRIIIKITKEIGTGGGHNSMAAGIIDRHLVRKNFNFETHLINIIKNL